MAYMFSAPAFFREIYVSFHVLNIKHVEILQNEQSLYLNIYLHIVR